MTNVNAILNTKLDLTPKTKPNIPKAKSRINPNNSSLTSKIKVTMVTVELFELEQVSHFQI